jgi:hypothetical protein
MTAEEWPQWCEGCTGAGYSNGGIIGDADFKCSSCHGTGRTPGIGPRLAQAWPIERVEVTDATWEEPWRGRRPMSILWIPPIEPFIAPKMLIGQPDEPAASSALSDALIAWARGQVIDAIPETARAI